MKAGTWVQSLVQEGFTGRAVDPVDHSSESAPEPAAAAAPPAYTLEPVLSSERLGEARRLQ